MSVIHNVPPFADLTESAAEFPLPKRQQGLELAVFLFLIVPAMVLSFFAAAQGGSFDLIAVATILRDLALVSLIAFFLWRNGEPRRAIGWMTANKLKEAALGVLLFIPLLAGTSILETFLRTIGLSGPPSQLPAFLTPKGGWGVALALVLVIVVAIAEETIFRGYLILRLEGLTGSRVAAAILSSILFSIGHGYEGTAGVITVGALGLALAIVYLWRGSLVAPMVMHFLQDFIGIIVLPLLAHK